MKKYSCEYLGSFSSIISGEWRKSIESDSPEEAYKIYIKKVGRYPKEVMVQTGLLSSITFDDHIKEDEKKAEEEQRKQIQEKRNQLAIKCLKFLEGKKEDGYFLLETDDKINAQLLFQEIISNSEKGPLFPVEVQYIEKWLSFKHRELGQSLLAQAEAKKPASERGKSQLAQTITMGIVAGNIAKANQLKELKELNESVDEIAEDVEDVSEGFEG